MSARLDQLRERVSKIIQRFKKQMPHPECALHHTNAEELLVATILSAQCTDARVNMVTPPLFKKYPTMKAFSQAKLPELEHLIHSAGFYKNKAKNIKACATDIVEKYGGKVPADMDALIGLAGVGRKTANVVLGNAFGIASGVVVDTHVTRLSFRLGLSKAKTAEKIEQELIELVPKEHWVNFSHWLILHGRSTCQARKPMCDKCFLSDLCPKIGVK
jgi:endonuclease-3